MDLLTSFLILFFSGLLCAIIFLLIIGITAVIENQFKIIEEVRELKEDKDSE